MAMNRRKDSLVMPALGQLPIVNSASGARPSIPYDLVWMTGSFGTNAAANPLPASFLGHNFTVTRTGTGAYLVTLGGASNATGGFNVIALASVQVTLQLATAGNSFAVPGVFTPNLGGAPSTLVITTLTAGAAADVAAAAANRINFTLAMISGGR